MSAWWWVLIGLAAWLGISLVVGLLLARFFRHAAQARDALDTLAEERLSERGEPPQEGPRVALRASKRGYQVPGGALPGARLPIGLVPAAARANRQGLRLREHGLLTNRPSWYRPVSGRRTRCLVASPVELPHPVAKWRR
jgi:hypothetical protein